MASDNIALFTILTDPFIGPNYPTYTTKTVLLNQYVALSIIAKSNIDFSIDIETSGDGAHFDYNVSRKVAGDTGVNFDIPVTGKFTRIAITALSPSPPTYFRFYCYGSTSNTSLNALIGKIGNANPEVDITADIARTALGEEIVKNGTVVASLTGGNWRTGWFYDDNDSHVRPVNHYNFVSPYEPNFDYFAMVSPRRNDVTPYTPDALNSAYMRMPSSGMVYVGNKSVQHTPTTPVYNQRPEGNAFGIVNNITNPQPGVDAPYYFRTALSTRFVTLKAGASYACRFTASFVATRVFAPSNVDLVQDCLVGPLQIWGDHGAYKGPIRNFGGGGITTGGRPRIWDGFGVGFFENKALTETRMLKLVYYWNRAPADGDTAPYLVIPQTMWNIDKADGTGLLPVFRVEDLQEYQFLFEGTGCADVIFGKMGPGNKFFPCHRFEHNKVFPPSTLQGWPQFNWGGPPMQVPSPVVRSSGWFDTSSIRATYYHGFPTEDYPMPPDIPSSFRNPFYGSIVWSTGISITEYETKPMPPQRRQSQRLLLAKTIGINDSVTVYLGHYRMDWVQESDDQAQVYPSGGYTYPLFQQINTGVFPWFAEGNSPNDCVCNIVRIQLVKDVGTTIGGISTPLEFQIFRNRRLNEPPGPDPPTPPFTVSSYVDASVSPIRLLQTNGVGANLVFSGVYAPDHQLVYSKYIGMNNAVDEIILDPPLLWQPGCLYSFLLRYVKPASSAGIFEARVYIERE